VRVVDATRPSVRQYLEELEQKNPAEPVHEQEQVSTTDPDSTDATKAALQGTKSVVGLQPERDLIVYFVHFRNELPDRFLNLGAYRRKLDTMLFLIAPNHSRGRLYRGRGGDVCAAHLMGSAPDRQVAQ
jgi:hypothetical protein